MSETEFEKIFRENFKPLCNLSASMVKDNDTAKDIVQQVFVNLWQKREKLNIHTAIKPYLYKAVVNTGINYLKKGKQLSPVDLAKGISSYDDNSFSKEEKETMIETGVHNAISKLPTVCQKVFRLSRFSELSNKEIANELNISVKAVEKHITKALKFLRDELKPLITSENVFFIIFLLSEVGFLIKILSILKSIYEQGYL